jgi:electron transfer flavoprotein beta subunit
VKVLVFLKEVPDIKVPCEDSAGGLRNGWNVSMLNPDDEAALGAALELKELSPEVRVTAVHIGPPSGERFIREALALGCDDAVRMWDEDLHIHSRAKALILARVAQIVGFDLLLSGTKSQDSASSQLGILTACNLSMPCITRAVALRLGNERVFVTKRLSEGYLQEIESSLPLVLAFDASDQAGSYASFPAVLEAAERRVPCLDLADIGLSRPILRDIEASLAFGPAIFPTPRFTPVAAPDSSLPAYERREKLREGSMVKREGKVVKGDDTMLVEEIFQYLLREGWLEHLSVENPVLPNEVSRD